MAMILNFFWIPIIEIIYCIGFVLVFIFNLIVDNWWIILSVIALWCVVRYIINHPLKKSKSKTAINTSSEKVVQLKHQDKSVKVRSEVIINSSTIINSRWTAFIGDRVHVLIFETKHGAMFYKASPVTLEIEDNKSWGIGYNCNANTITFFGSVSIENKSYNFKKGIVEGNKLTISFETLSENGEWLSGEFYFALVRNNGEYTIIYGDY
ncbi:MAG: hypothetical protein K2M94_05950 [Paramuribaculum sp.]|nr:hypothetical protein [Paramuribaculum sp.]